MRRFLLMYLISHSCIYYRKVSAQILCPSLNCLWFIIRRFFIYAGYQLFAKYIIWMFLLFFGLDCNTPNLVTFNLSVILSIVFLVSYLESVAQSNQRSQRFMPKFSWDKCILIALAFSSCFHFEFGSTRHHFFFRKTIFFPIQRFWHSRWKSIGQNVIKINF